MDVKKRLIAGTINKYPNEEGWENTHLDLSDRPLYDIATSGWAPVDVVANLASGDLREKLDKSSFDEVRCHQVFEHLTIEQAPVCIENFLYLLKKGGVLDIEVPNIAVIIRGYQEHKLTWYDMVRNIYGGSSPTMQEDHYNAHRWGWSYNTLRELLLGFGFAGITNPSPDGYQLRLRAVTP